MSKKPLIAIVGRPNVGKSTLFNKIAGARISIVENTPGVTRDRVYAETEWNGRHFAVVDTGGLELKSRDEMWMHIKEQAQIAIDNADAIVLVVDGKTGITQDDAEVAKYLRAAKAPVILAVNKLDGFDQSALYDFFSLGFGEPIGISAEQGFGLGDLLDKMVEDIDRNEGEEDGENIKVAIVGKPNAGKSSIVNRLLGYRRVIVSDVAGTTRDAIDTEIEVDGQKYTLIDTAGIRKKRGVTDDVEYFSVLRAFMAVRRADVCAIVLDASAGITEQDSKIAGFVHDEGKASMFLVNKWDLIEKDNTTVQTFKNKLKSEFKFMNYVSPLFVSAETGQRVDKILPYAKSLYQTANKRISTGLLNEALAEATRIAEPPSKGGKNLKLLYITQVSAAPPTFVLKVNDPMLVHFSYKRYLENALRKTFDFAGTPVRLIFRKNSEG
jgi:GTP-binding protein